MHGIAKYTLSVVLGAVLSVSIPSFLKAGGVQVFPLTLFISAPTRSVTIDITNPLERPQEAWVEFKFGYPVRGDSGKFVMHYADAPYTGEPSAVPWLKSYPQRFVLGPKESQVARILVTPPAGIQSGEYWARVIVSSMDQNAPATPAPGGNLSIKMKFVNQIDVPLHVRIGKATTSVSIRKVETSVLNGTLNLDIDLARSGNAAFWGKVTATIKNRDGKILINHDKPVAIYKDIIYPLSIDISTVPAGTYTLDLEFSTNRPGMRSQYLLKADPVRYSQEITVP